MVFFIQGAIFFYFSGLRDGIEDQLNDNRYYCAYTPFMFAYVLLIINWIVVPFALCCTCMIISSAICCAATAASTAAYSAAATSDPSVTVSTA